MASVYDSPKYYEIAFSFRDIAAEVDVFEACFERFSRIRVESVLELGCGNSPHMAELAKRGYRYNGLDLSEGMLEYSRAKASTLGIEANLIRGNMLNFALEAPVEFVYIMLGSLSAGSTADLISHFDSVAQALKLGGLYFLDWCIQYETPLETEGGSSWEFERDGVTVNTTVSWKAISRAEQTFEESLVLKVNDHGEELEIAESYVKRAIYPQEFLLLVSSLKDFEFVGWWNNWNLSQTVEEADKISRPIALIRRV